MLFSSATFLFYFLPVVLCVYFIAPKKMKNVVLLLASLFFYAWGEPRYVLVMLIATIQGYLFGRIIEKRIEKDAKIWLGVSIFISLGLLCYCKYVDFFVESVNAVTGLTIPMLKIALPIGISFYTFQIIGYTVDIYRKQVTAEKNIIDFAAYVTMFSQLIAGPIVRYCDIATELKSRTSDVSTIANGCKRFVFGLSKKVLIANVLGELVETYKQTQDSSISFVWLYAIAYTLHVFFDFSGYSDMAIGLGEILGFHFPENFNYPYSSGSITEFWKRWHISLGSWFRDYLYIPLGGNRVPKWKWYRNILIVWMATGLWHGAAWNFVIWGLLFAVLLVIEKVGLLKILEKTKIWNHIYVMLLVIISFVIFDAVDMKMAFTTLKSMFGFGGLPLASVSANYYFKSYRFMLMVAVIGATPLPKYILTKVNQYRSGKRILAFIESVWVFLLFVVCTSFLVDGSYNPFLYFRF